MKRKLSSVYLIGAGGVGSYLLPVLLKTLHAFENPPVTIIDGDFLEAGNINRQLFPEHLVGENKGKALVKMYGSEYQERGGLLSYSPMYFTDGHAVQQRSLLLVCADNHPARRAALTVADEQLCDVIIGANETTDSEAYYYTPEYCKTGLDPRVMHPEIETNTANDPLHPASCTGNAQLERPQLAMANYMASAFMLHLFWYHYAERGRLDGDAIRDYSPFLHRSNFSRIMTSRTGDVYGEK
jgi:molybdopterin/thiamine biosynthesis adenylyltransferase